MSRNSKAWAKRRLAERHPLAPVGTGHESAFEVLLLNLAGCAAEYEQETGSKAPALAEMFALVAKARGPR